MSCFHRLTLVAASFFGVTFNLVLAIHSFGAWRSLPWEPASEWEGPGFSLDRDGARLICGLFSAYFAAASAISMFGLAGIIKVCSPLYVSDDTIINRIYLAHTSFPTHLS